VSGALRSTFSEKRRSPMSDPMPDSRAARSRADLSVGDGQIRNRAIELRRAHLQERAPGRCRRGPDFRAAADQSSAAARAPLIRARRGVPLDDGHSRRRDTKFLGRHLRERDADAGTDIDLARVEGDRPVGVNRQQPVDLTSVDRPSPRDRCDLRQCIARGKREREADHNRAAGFQQVAA
jgi:hypothetical protein